MKPLKNFLIEIFEARKIVGTLPFTKQELKEFANDGWDGSSQIFKKMKSAIEDKYGSSVWSGFKGFIEGTWYGTDIGELYDILSKQPVDRLKKILGGGSNAVALDLGNNMVIKWFHKNTPMNDDDDEFYEYCINHPSKVFPKVYKVGKNFAVIEKLKTNTKKCKEYAEWIDWSPTKFIPISLSENDTQDGKSTMEECVRNYHAHKKEIDAAIKKLPKIAKEVFDWSLECFERLKEFAPYEVTGFQDMRLANIGERENGEIVWFDI